MTKQQYHLDVQEAQALSGIGPSDKTYGVDPESHYGTLTTWEAGKPKPITYPTVAPPTYTEYYRVFARALKGKGQVPCSPEDARDVLRIIEQALLSSKEGRTVDF